MNIGEYCPEQYIILLLYNKNIYPTIVDNVKYWMWLSVIKSIHPIKTPNLSYVASCVFCYDEEHVQTIWYMDITERPPQKCIEDPVHGWVHPIAWLPLLKESPHQHSSPFWKKITTMNQTCLNDKWTILVKTAVNLKAHSFSNVKWSIYHKTTKRLMIPKVNQKP